MDCRRFRHNRAASRCYDLGKKLKGAIALIGGVFEAVYSQMHRNARHRDDSGLCQFYAECSLTLLTLPSSGSQEDSARRGGED